MGVKLFDSELKVMEVLWAHGPMTAAQIVVQLKASTGWNRNTTYTVIKKCVEKGAIKRSEPGFLCSALVTKAEAQAAEADELIDRMFDGSTEKFLVSMLTGERLNPDEIDRLKQIVNKLQP